MYGGLVCQTWQKSFESQTAKALCRDVCVKAFFVHNMGSVVATL